MGLITGIDGKFECATTQPKAGVMDLITTIHAARREMKHVRSPRTSKKHADKIKAISDSTLTAAMRWLGHATVCRIIKQAINSEEVSDEFAKEYAKVA
jgi:hypothetical protein